MAERSRKSGPGKRGGSGRPNSGKPRSSGGPRQRRDDNKPRGSRSDKPRSNSRPDDNSRNFGDRKEGGKNKKYTFRNEGDNRGFRRKPTPQVIPDKVNAPQRDERIRLNRFIARAGVCSRREADTLIGTGAVTVNGIIVTELGTKVLPTDVVKVAGETLRSEKHIYVLLNKPKDYITTVTDPQKRRTVMDLLKGAGKERIYPVGRLDRATTGVLLLTNDGDLAKKLTHPKHGVQKIYHVEVQKPFSVEDMNKLLTGITLEDGPVKVDAISYTGNGANKKSIGVELHSGRNRIIRRMMEELGYKVLKLDRVSFAGLTKKALPRGTWRHLEEREVGFLKML